MAEEQMQVDFTQLVNEIANRLRILESKQGLLSEKMLVMNQNMKITNKATIINSQCSLIHFTFIILNYISY